MTVETITPDSQTTKTGTSEDGRVIVPGKPWLKPWQPGQTGNPGGSNGRPVTQALMRKLDPATLDRLAESIVNLALSGNIAAIMLILERIEGKVPLPVAVTAVPRLDLSHIPDAELREIVERVRVSRAKPIVEGTVAPDTAKQD